MLRIKQVILICMKLDERKKEGRKLRAFDMDDTMITTKSYIYVKHKNGKESKLSPGEFAVYEPKKGDDFDFRDFHDLKEPKLIKRTEKFYRKILKAVGKREIVILTARPNSLPLIKFLKDTNLYADNVRVVALGSSNPMDKAKWLANQVIHHNVRDVYFIDDSTKNVKAVEGMIKKLQNEYEDLKYKVQVAKLT